jgi:DNA-binding transcriptional LysR family regulator
MGGFELRYLRYFVTVARHLNFTRAAAELGMPQPALSRHIQAFEALVGTSLFERTKRKVLLTAVGEAMLPDALLSVARAEAALANARRVASGHSGHVTIAFSSAAIFHPLVADLIQRFRRANPDIVVTLKEIPMASHFEAMRSGEADISFVHLDPHDLVPHRARFRNILTMDVVAIERLVIAVPATDPLAERTSASLAEIADRGFLALPYQLSLTTNGPFRRLSLLRGEDVRIEQEVQSVPATIHLAGAGLGIAITVESVTSIATPLVRYVPLVGKNERRFLLCVAAVNPSKAALAFKTMAESSATGDVP